MGQLKVIVQYLALKLQANHVRLEPVYGKNGEGFHTADANEFVDNYLKAQKEAYKLGIQVSTSGVRLNEIHSTFCDVLRDTIRLTPDGTAVSCFCEVDGRQLKNAENAIGHFDFLNNQYILDNNKIAAVNKKVFSLPDACQSCINIYHCSRGCPDFCPLERGGNSYSEQGRLNEFRCKVHVGLATKWVRQQASQIIET